MNVNKFLKKIYIILIAIILVVIAIVAILLINNSTSRVVITNDKEIADIADMAIMIDESESIYAFYQAAIVMQLLSCEMAFTKGTYQDHVPVLSGRTNTF